MSLVVLLGCCCMDVCGQTATAVVREGDPLPGDEVGGIVTGINNSANNGYGGFSFTVITDGSTSHVWGTPDEDAAPAILATETLIGDFMLTSIEAFFGMSDAGDVFYSPSSVNIVTNEDGLDGVVLNSSFVQNELDSIANLPGLFSTFNSRPGMTADGQPYWIGGITNMLGGVTQDRVLFLGTDAKPILRGGDMIGGIMEPLDMGSSIDFDSRFSGCGSNYITVGTLDATPDIDGVVITNGAAIFLDGEFIREGNAIPKSVGGIGDNYDNFDFLGISEYGGKYMITGDTDADASQDEFVLVNGEIVLREGDMIDGTVLSGGIEGAYLTEDGNWTCIWDVDTEVGNREALIANGELLLVEGNAVDWNGDGVIDASDNGAMISDFTGISSLTASRASTKETFRIYFTADVDVGGMTLEGGFELEVPSIPILLGDMNCDGQVDLLDVAPFVKFLSSGVYAPQADINQDGAVNLLDIDPFVTFLGG